MPLTPPGLTASILPALVGVGCLGTGTPKLALGVAFGLVRWAATARVPISAAGAAGVGAVSFPLLVPAPLLVPPMLAAFAGAGMIGIFSPVFATGLCTGISTGLAQGLILAATPGVGSGAGVATFRGLAQVAMVQGFAQAGLVGERSVQEARAIGQGLDTFFAVFSLPVPVVGPVGSAPGTSLVTGQIV